MTLASKGQSMFTKHLGLRCFRNANKLYFTKLKMAANIVLVFN